MAAFVWKRGGPFDELDRELERTGHKFARYDDDFIIMVKSTAAGERALSRVRKFLERELKLGVNMAKSKVALQGGSAAIDARSALEQLCFVMRFERPDRP